MKKWTLFSNLSVVGVHLAVIIWMVIDGRTTREPDIPKRLTVQTVSLKSAPRPLVIASAPPAKVIPKKEPVKPKPPAAPVVSPIVKKTNLQNKQREEQVEKARKCLALVGQNKVALPDAVSSLSVDSKNTLDPKWRDQIGTCLKQSLVLPEVGDVTFELELLGTGSVVKFLVIRSACNKNKKYIEESISRVNFPKSTQEKKGSFVITLSHQQ